MSKLGATKKETELSSRPAGIRLAVAAALGIVAGIASYAFGIPGNGEFVALAWVAGFLAIVIAPGLLGWGTILVGIVIGLVATGAGSGALVFLAAAILAAIASHGALVATGVNRARRVGLAVAVRDGRVLGLGAIAVAVAVSFAWMAWEFARNPA